ncbi:winged helix-turn-helix transcriptional regulator [Pseudomaricurvus alkylphenolicus]|jgi:Lrp/AsnC family leucine-responsive transcriptional regulator|uniref:Lrp/AsnC ligand binding domain-containing protein n=1 Tax=Pseudomaricurvus alkylphenolicus TaxID=1306991 RepID=UPI001422E8F5|nr:Lrp/AsnC ligand binding domain-containing protein [Pseudomaricurvus alkylphenolicus]NIB43275.1 winged helix-turn-helix transcriptional regulator [Pseudomaricurvus alkylphenolicus]
MEKLNTLDKNIIRVLQKNGRTSFAELSRQVGLSATPCKERVKRLERDGVIKGYTALINPDYLDAGLVVFVQIRLSRSAQDTFEAFRDAAMALPEIQECYLVSGSFDYLLKARVADMGSYRKFYGETLLTLPGVHECTSYVVMEEVKDTTEIPVHYNR